MSAPAGELDDHAVGTRISLLFTTPFVLIWSLYWFNLLDAHFSWRAGFQQLAGFAASVPAAFPIALAATAIGRCIPSHRFFTFLTIFVTVLVLCLTSRLVSSVADGLRSEDLPGGLRHRIYPALVFCLGPICTGAMVFRLAPRVIPQRNLHE